MAYNYPGAPDSVPDLIAAYERQPEEVAGLVRGMSGEQWRAHPVPNRWSCIELLCHLVDSDIVLTDRMKRTIAMDRPLIMAYDENTYVARLGYAQRDPAEEMEMLRLVRRQMARILRSLSPEDWERHGIHSETGLKTTKQFAQMAVGHINHHLPFLLEKRKALGIG